MTQSEKYLMDVSIRIKYPSHTIWINGERGISYILTSQKKYAHPNENISVLLLQPLELHARN